LKTSHPPAINPGDEAKKARYCTAVRSHRLECGERWGWSVSWAATGAPEDGVAMRRKCSRFGPSEVLGMEVVGPLPCSSFSLSFSFSETALYTKTRVRPTSGSGARRKNRRVRIGRSPGRPMQSARALGRKIDETRLARELDGRSTEPRPNQTERGYIRANDAGVYDQTGFPPISLKQEYVCLGG